MSALLGGAQQVSQLRALPRFPAVRRDLSLIVPESSRFEAVRNVIEESELPDLEDVEYVGSYRGKPLEKGTKSITISLVFRSKEQTLTSEAVDASVKRVIDRAFRKIDAILRT
jgi:phenylalanyl-tRNA synthetase beta chain